MKLTATQQTQVKKILQNYKREVNSILKTHRQQITALLENLDKKKAEELKKMISSA